MTKPMLCLLLAASAAVAQGQTVWRCGADGRSYGDQPCGDGRVVDVGDARNRVEGADASIAMQREQRLAAQLADQRRERERELLALRGAAPRTAPARDLRPKQAEPPAPSHPKARKRQHRLAAAGTSRAVARASRSVLD
jgi:hypothetical protein